MNISLTYERIGEYRAALIDSGPRLWYNFSAWGKTLLIRGEPVEKINVNQPLPSEVLKTPRRGAMPDQSSPPPPQDVITVDVESAAKALLKNKTSPETHTLWSHGQGSYKAPQIAPEGVCMASGTRIECIDPLGNPVWSYDAKTDISSPAVSPDGTVYVCSSDGALQAIGAKGALRWKVPLPVDADHNPAVTKDGLVVVVGKDGNLHGINSDSHEVWSTRIKPLIDLDPSPDLYTDPVATPDGGVLVANKKKYLLHFDANGSRRWKYRVPGELTMNPGVDAHGTIALGAYFDTLVVLNSRGKEQWRKSLVMRVASTPAFGADGSVYVGDDGGRVHAFTAGGRDKWTFRADSKIMAKPAVSPDGTVYVCSWMGGIYAVAPDGGRPLWKSKTGGLLVSNPCLVPGGTLYVIGAGGSLVAFNEHKAETIAAENASASKTPQGGPQSSRIQDVDGWVIVDGVRLPIHQEKR